jgi:hypothetical protein
MYLKCAKIKATWSTGSAGGGEQMKRIIIVLTVMIIAILACGGSSSGSSGGSGSSGSSWSCVEYDPPYDVVFIDGTADVYGGVEEPSNSVKGTITEGAAGIEARCSGSSGSFYRLKGVDWWGWVKISDTYK